MQCGSRCFLVTMELEGKAQTKEVTARTPVDARKMIRKEYGAAVRIVSVVAEKKQA